MKLGEVLHHYRIAHHLTQKEVAALLGVTREYYGRLEREKGIPSVRLLERICTSTSISIDGALLNRNGEKARKELRRMCELCLALREEDRQEIRKLMERMGK